MILSVNFGRRTMDGRMVKLFYSTALRYRLGLDMGATSIGWAVYDIDNQCVIDTGVRIFDDGREDKSKASLCVKRRNARGARRLVNRRHMRINELLKLLTQLGLFPKSSEDKEKLKNLNPYELRKEALDRQLQSFEFGRALLQLAKRKGFKSNRKDNKQEGGKLKRGFEQLRDAMSEEKARTYGEFLYLRSKSNPQKPIRLVDVFDISGKYQGGLFPFREIYQEEFNKIWETQKNFYPQILTEENRKKIAEVIFFQRPLKETEEGECLFEKGQKRVPKAHPLFQEFRIYQNLVNLQFAEETAADYHGLSQDDLQKLGQMLQNPTEIKPNAQGIIVYSNIKKALGLDRKGIFNYERKNCPESGLEKGILVNTTQYAINHSEFLASYWNNFSDDQKGEIINVITRPRNYIAFPKTKLSIEEEDKLIIDYLQQSFGISCKAAEELLYDIDLEEDFGSLSEKAIRKILPFIKSGMLYSDACLEAGYQHSSKTCEHLDKLPYYGEILSQSCLGKKCNPSSVEEEFGKINNATVHVALNQIRHLINELIERYGKPYDIAVEYARDLNASTKDRLKMMDTRDRNELENQRILKEMNDKIGVRAYNKRDIQKYKIWKKLSFFNGNPLIRECPFSGEPIAIADLLNGQKFQIEHLIPFSLSLDDSLNNKVLASVEANRYKGNRIPYKAFGESKDGYDWNAIQKRAKKLSLEQQWRFAPDALQRFEKQEGPIARSINDTRYMTRLLQDYLQPVVNPEGQQRVQAVAGILTAMIRKAWGLNQYKNKENEDEYRAFHNHHAIDAIIISVIERSQIAEVSKRLKKVSESVIAEFKDEFYKLRDENVSKEEKTNLKKNIKNFVLEREEGIINQYFRIPDNMNVLGILERVEKINISHKPSLKKIDSKNSTIGKLHEDSAYGLQKFVDDKSLKAIFKFAGKTIEKDITEYIPMFYNKKDKEAYYDVYKQWFVLDKKAGTLIEKNKAEKILKKQMANKEQIAIQNLREAAKKAFKWFVGGGNFCAEVYEINPSNKICGLPTSDRGEWKMEIVSNFNATLRQARKEDIAYWRYKYPNAKKIMTLKRNDMVVATFSKDQAFEDKFPKGLRIYVRNRFLSDRSLEKTDVLFRVKKMTGGTICLTPHNIAKEQDDTKSWLASAGSMKRYLARKVFVTSAGRVQNAK